MPAGKRSDKPPAAKDVNEYLAALPEDQRLVLEGVRRAIKSAAPQAEERISYRVPTYKYHGPLVAFFAATRHCSLVTMSESVVATFRGELAGFEVSGTTIHFTPEHPLPAALVRKIVKARRKENEASAP